MSRLGFAALLPLLWPTATWAGQTQVAPTRIELTADSAAGMVTLTNAGTTPVAYEIEVFAWDESEDGQMLLEPSTGLTVFPRLVEIPPGDARNVRVGSRTKPDATQRYYRLMITELARPSASVGVIHVLTRFGIPVFVGGAGKAEPRVVSLRKDTSGNLELRVKNAGAMYGVLRDVAISSPDFAQAWRGWYLLRGRERVYRAPLPARELPAELAVRLTFEDGTTREDVVHRDW